MSRELVSPLDTDWYRCAKCKRSYFVKSKDPQKHLLKKSMRCPNYVRCQGRIVKKLLTADSGEIRNYNWTTAVELYQASAGLGLESERDCSPDTIRNLLHGYRIMTTDLQEAGDPKKSLILSLTLENGKVLHLAPSTKGAIIYKVTELANGG